MKIIATKVKCKDLKAGDLFSTEGDLYWSVGRDRNAIGEKVFIRAEGKCSEDEAENYIYKITIEKDNG